MRNSFTIPRFSDFTVEQPSLEQFVLLSMMLHVLAIVLFGDTNGGGPRRGEKIWGALTVTVQTLLPGDGVRADSYVAPLQPPVKPRALAPAPAPPRKASLDKRARGALPVENPSPAVEPAPPSQAPAIEIPPVIAKEVEKAETDFAVPKPSVDRMYAPAAQTQPSEPAPREIPPAPPLPVPVPAIVPPPAAVALPIIERAPIVPIPVPVPVPIKPTPREAPVVTPAPTAAAPVPVAAPPAPVAAPPIPAPAARPDPVAPKLAPEVTKPVVVAPEPKPREVAPPVVPPVEVKPREVPAPAAVSPPAVSEPPRVEAPKAPKIEREIVTPAAAPPTTVATPPATAPTTQTRTPATAPPGNPTATERDLLKPRGDSPTAPADTLGLPVTPALGKAPALDLDAIRRRAREINSGTGPRTAFPFPVAPVPKPKSKEQQAFDKALKKNDCRDAYADMGLAAVVPLVISAVREDGCKW